ncbi:MAG: EAL domain-containing protein [Clostridia bacterium]|nr:EAL domain-containing protein [Clostridia bacterium]
MYQFPKELKEAYESSPLSFVYYQNIEDKPVPVLVSEGFCRNTGASRDHVLEWLEAGMFERMHPDDVGVVSKISDDFLHHRGSYDTVFRCLLAPPAGDADAPEYVLIHGLGKWQTMPDGTELAVITYANLSQTHQMMGEQMEAYNMLRNDVFYTDSLTELPNLNYLHEFGDEKINVVRAEGHTPTLVYLDIYAMQSYNNQYGYREGDKLLCLAAKTLKLKFPQSLVARGPDDHFIVITDLEDAQELEQRLCAANTILRNEATGNTAGMRAGVYQFEDEQVSFADALDYARQTLKFIENDLNREVAFFSRKLNEAYWRARYILENFNQALENGWIKVYYHGLYRVESQKVAAFEALARWIDPVRGTIHPQEFIPVLLKYHQLYKLDLYMFEQVCREVIIRHDNGLPLVPVSVNFSRQDFIHADVVGEMNRLYDKYKMDDYVDKSYFIVEITEQDLALGEKKVIEQLSEIRANGYRLWLDDFGSGYSAINVFSRFEFDLIKYDLELLRHLDEHDGMNRLILQELVYLARKLGIHTLVEGLETEEHLDFVKTTGCELVQGFYYHKPESLDEILIDIQNGRMVKPCETPEERAALNQKWFENV